MDFLIRQKPSFPMDLEVNRTPVSKRDAALHSYRHRFEELALEALASSPVGCAKVICISKKTFAPAVFHHCNQVVLRYTDAPDHTAART